MVSPIPPGAFHASRQKLARMLDFQEVARNDEQIDDALRQATSNTEGYLHRGFFPWRGTRYRDWPDRDYADRLWLDGDEFVSLTTATSGGTTLATNNLVYYPTSGPPYNAIETSVASSAYFQAGATWQSAIALTGLWCGTDASTRPAGTLAAGINASVTTLALTPLSTTRIGVGDLLLCGTEYLVVTALTSATSSQTLQTPLTASAASTSVAVSTGSAFVTGEAITLDSEQMLVVDVTGNTLVVKRAWNGTVLATHTGSTIYASRTLTVTRGACGSTAASHNSADAVGLHIIPPSVQALTLAEASWIYAGHSAGWQVAPGTTNRSTTQLAGLEVMRDLRTNAARVAGRKQRARAV